jgi:P-type E1-E2 ATPase
VAEILEQLTVSQGRRAIAGLLQFLPRTAEVFRHEKLFEIPAAQLKRGDRVLVRPGARIPVDGEIFNGSSYVDQSAITGEPRPVKKTQGDAVFAGTINQPGAIEVFVNQVGGDTTFGRIVEVVERAEQTPAPIQRIADRLAGYLVYFAMGAAAHVFDDP